MINKDTAAILGEIAGRLEFDEYEEIKFAARDMATKIDSNGSKDNMLWIMCLRLTAQILADAAKNRTSVHKYLTKDNIYT